MQSKKLFEIISSLPTTLLIPGFIKRKTKNAIINIADIITFIGYIPYPNILFKK